MKFYLPALLTCVLAACSNPPAQKQGLAEHTATDSVIVQGNITTRYSTDVAKLDTFLDFKTARPVKVKFKRFSADNSGQGERLAVPGPSDAMLEAVMYFDPADFKKLSTSNIDFTTTYSASEFNFDWLDPETADELQEAGKTGKGCPDFFFGTRRGKCFYLRNKILIKEVSN